MCDVHGIECVLNGTPQRPGEKYGGVQWFFKISACPTGAYRPLGISFRTYELFHRPPCALCAWHRVHYCIVCPVHDILASCALCMITMHGIVCIIASCVLCIVWVLKRLTAGGPYRPWGISAWPLYYTNIRPYRRGSGTYASISAGRCSTHSFDYRRGSGISISWYIEESRGGGFKCLRAIVRKAKLKQEGKHYAEPILKIRSLQYSCRPEVTGIF